MLKGNALESDNSDDMAAGCDLSCPKCFFQVAVGQQSSHPRARGESCARSEQLWWVLNFEKKYKSMQASTGCDDADPRFVFEVKYHHGALRPLLSQEESFLFSNCKNQNGRS